MSYSHQGNVSKKKRSGLLKKSVLGIILLGVSTFPGLIGGAVGDAFYKKYAKPSAQSFSSNVSESSMQQWAYRGVGALVGVVAFWGAACFATKEPKKRNYNGHVDDSLSEPDSSKSWEYDSRESGNDPNSGKYWNEPGSSGGMMW